MNILKQFQKEKKSNIKKIAQDTSLNSIGIKFISRGEKYKYSYHFTWLDRPIIQYPQDMIAMQEIIWKVKPDLIIETGIAHGGSLIFYASLLELIGEGEVLGIDIEIRPHNRVEIEKHHMYKRIKMIEGSSVDRKIFNEVKKIAIGKKSILVALDSNHTHKHVLKEIELYSTLVTKGSYLIVFDTIIEDMPDKIFTDRPWGKGNNPKTAVKEFLKKNNQFSIDKSISNKLVISAVPDGYLKRVK